MKKFVLIVCLLVVALTLTQTVVALAEVSPTQTTAQYTEKDIQDFVKQNKNVNDAHVALLANKCIVAVQPKEMLTKSQYGEFKTNMKKEIAEKFKGVDEVHITMNARAFKEIEKLNKLSAQEKQRMFEQIIRHMNNRRNPRSNDDKRPQKDDQKPQILPYEKPNNMRRMPKR